MPSTVDYIEPLVTTLTRYYLDGGQDLVEQYGDQAPALASELGEMVGDRLTEDTPFAALWDEYVNDPIGNEAELIGALEALEEADNEFSLRMEGYFVAFQELEQPGVESLIETSEPEDTLNADELTAIKSTDDMDNDDEYIEENTYLVGNVEDHSTSALYIEGLDTSVEPNESETVETSEDQEDES